MNGMIDAKLVEQYSGTGASGYDQQREQTPRFKSEERAFAELFDRCSPQWVVDCPVGTGRWQECYRRLSGRVTGVDASSAMLTKATGKYRSAGVDVSLKEGSIFDVNCFRSLRQADDGLVVCIRFMNWIDIEQVAEAMDSLAQCEPKHMIIGVSVRPMEWSAWRRFLAKVALIGLNLVPFVKRLSLPKVHDESLVSGVFNSRGWEVVARKFVYEDKARRNFLYLLKRRHS